MLTKKELCKRWKVSERFVEKLSREKLPRLDISGGARRGTFRFRMSDVEAYELENLSGPCTKEVVEDD